MEATYQMNDRLSISAGINNVFDVYPEENIASTPASVAVGVNGSDNAGTIPYNAISPFGFSGRFYYMSAMYGF
jgi:iron complex outermembrane receptor protein